MISLPAGVDLDLDPTSTMAEGVRILPSENGGLARVHNA
jgi:hypothetical protein